MSLIRRMKMSKVTVVSALFDIERLDGRPWAEYLKWFDIFLKLFLYLFLGLQL